ncbi:MAG: 16S rRNA (adenine(1518)-N(6)/adenine(1519)-N(6))-dimethyltransferase RsmA [Jaaginema sp. PMC 1079.18]|nr:16S rRNA (adenine(1518)-N(6)/adenine(1519)-N(6))-dimethyltransferase RsmA [Jaaginema sp. PMC 1080.18]MEC4852160.1 16S rRNA (adenine(1518)-N(6)/adenine(1519)-N(6))-dimethyltransferase RsmA [Jaaginema sp. PMC 1079.18]MEC4864847.1 16S rRNA (adenine(1518)-N(6)/adenine(1519)-N(6))-dimethyltransferase RsmA [Jaaginema sp. PMC 1078.18]
MKPRKRFAQHWLRSEKALNKIIAAAELKEKDRVLEIGPGMGVLTKRLSSISQAVVAVEIDRDLCKKLVGNLGHLENFLLLQGDFLSLDLDDNLETFPLFQSPNKVVANIPYNITGLILKKLLGSIAQPKVPHYESVVLLVQREIADRVTAQPGHKAYSAMSVRVQYLAKCEKVCDVPAKAFYPPPKVDSAVIRLYPQLPEIKAQNPRFLEQLIELGFANRRKMLRKNLSSVIDRTLVSSILDNLELNPQARAEDLGVRDWVQLSHRILAQRELLKVTVQ